jgi:hypothetical protein
MSRTRLPNRRASSTFYFTCTNLCYTCTYSCDASGKITELFLGNHKSNSAADTVARDAAIVCSLALQHGADPETIRCALCPSGPDQRSSAIV